MTKGLEALKEYRKQQQGVNVYADELLDIVEKELKALEIIKNKWVDWQLLVTSKVLTHEEFELLKEVFEWKIVIKNYFL